MKIFSSFLADSSAEGGRKYDDDRFDDVDRISPFNLDLLMNDFFFDSIRDLRKVVFLLCFYDFIFYIFYTGRSLDRGRRSTYMKR